MDAAVLSPRLGECAEQGASRLGERVKLSFQFRVVVDHHTFILTASITRGD